MKAAILQEQTPDWCVLAEQPGPDGGTMSTRKKRHTQNAFSLCGDLMLAPAVVAMRLPLIALDASSRAPKGIEAMLAVNEKALAFAEGMAAAQLVILRSALWFWPEVLSGRSPSFLSGGALKDSMVAALKPAGRRVRTNFNRLSKLS
ncbi:MULTISPECIES: hypothetical protein [unclassified Mesorhizobium]|uniref:hypothetical protein n=1 Tax=unclassified Mesorhizobium TaxID=325217 RepID=UPI0024154F6B|nr:MULTISPECIES: hypothetical protein [unclassified Mesorhizobium]MDG4852492.1 hypothetical protein [Mesorhizobium sp. WSM4982]MDG4911941.1 hypothetical protein [Mesorhizobium sp. WSM4983]